MMSCQELSKQENNIYNMIKNKQNKIKIKQIVIMEQIKMMIISQKYTTSE